MMTKDALVELMDKLVPAMYEAGDAIMAIHAKKVTAKYKADGSPVTQADEAAEAILLPALAQFAPDIPVISDENAASHEVAATSLFFLVDPIDGTKEFLKKEGGGAFTVNIGLISNGAPVIGLVYAPAFDTLYKGVVGKGAMKVHKGVTKALNVRDVPPSGAVAVASASHRDADTQSWLDTHQITQIKSIGSSLKFCLLADGEADVYPRFGPTMEWDTAAGDGVLRAAGGTVQGRGGQLFSYGKDNYYNTAFIAIGKWRAS